MHANAACVRVRRVRVGRAVRGARFFPSASVRVRSTAAEGPAAFDVNFHSFLIEVQSIINSQIPPSTDQPGVDNALFCNNSTSTLGWPVRSGI